MDCENEEYELQHFNFSVKQMIFSNRFMIMENIHEYENILLEEIITKKNIPMATAMKLREKLESAATKTYTEMKSHIRVIEDALNKNYKIPPNVLLANDLAHVKQYTEAEEEQLSKDLAELELIFKQCAVFIMSLNQELEFYDKIAPQIMEEEKWINNVEQNMRLESSSKTEVFDVVCKKIQDLKK